MNSGVVGAIVGILGGLLGTYFSIRNTTGQRERRFVICAAVATWAVLGLLALLIYAFPRATGVAMTSFFGLLPFAILYLNRRQAAIREQERNA